MRKFNWKKKLAKVLVFVLVMGMVSAHGAVKAPAEVKAANSGFEIEAPGNVISIAKGSELKFKWRVEEEYSEAVINWTATDKAGRPISGVSIKDGVLEVLEDAPSGYDIVVKATTTVDGVGLLTEQYIVTIEGLYIHHFEKFHGEAEGWEMIEGTRIPEIKPILQEQISIWLDGVIDGKNIEEDKIVVSTLVNGMESNAVSVKSLFTRQDDGGYGYCLTVEKAKYEGGGLIGGETITLIVEAKNSMGEVIDTITAMVKVSRVEEYDMDIKASGNATSIVKGSELKFEWGVAKKYPEAVINWTATNKMGKQIPGVSIKDGVLKVSKDVPSGYTIIIEATTIVDEMRLYAEQRIRVEGLFFLEFGIFDEETQEWDWEEENLEIKPILQEKIYFKLDGIIDGKYIEQDEIEVTALVNGMKSDAVSVKQLWEDGGECYYCLIVEKVGGIDGLKGGETITLNAVAKNSAGEVIDTATAMVKVSGGEGNPNLDSTTCGISINYTDYTATITPSKKDKYVFLEVLKSGDENAKILDTYCYIINNNQPVVVDLSFLNAKKAQYVRVYGDSDMNAKVPKIPMTIYQQPTKEALKYVPGKDTVAESFAIKGTVLTADTVKKYEYKSLYGKEWHNLESWSIKSSSIAGTTLIIRRAAVAEKINDPTVTPAPAGPEIKVKVTANPKAPKVIVDYNKDTITLPKGGEFHLITEVGEQEGWQPVPSNNKLSVAALIKAADSKYTEAQVDALVKSGFTIIVRTKATDKKAASNLTFVKIDPQPQIGQTKGINEIRATGDNAPPGSVTWEVKTDSKTKKSTATFTVKDASFEFSVDGGNKWKNVKSGGTYVVKDVTTTAKKVLIRRAGIKPAKDGTGASPASNQETVEVKVEETVSAGDKQ